MAKKARHVAQRQPAEVMHEPMARAAPTSETGHLRLAAPSSCKEWAHHVNDTYVRLNSGAQLLDIGRELLRLIELHPGSLGTFYRSCKLMCFVSSLCPYFSFFSFWAFFLLSSLIIEVSIQHAFA